MEMAADPLIVAILHTVFKLVALAILMPMSNLLVKLSEKLVPESKRDEQMQLLDERLLATPSVAIERCRVVAVTMAEMAVSSMKDALDQLTAFDPKKGEAIRAVEDKVDYYEDNLGTYLVKVSAQEMSETDSAVASELLHIIGDFERISDHAVNIQDSAEEIYDKQLSFSAGAKRELAIMVNAVTEILDLSLAAFRDNDLDSAIMVEPLEQVVDFLKDFCKKKHIARLQRQACTIEMGFILSDVLTNLERISDHCSNIAACLLEMSHESMDMHQYLRDVKAGDTKEYNHYYEYFKMKYAVE